MPKANRNGQALVLSPEQMDAIMRELTPTSRAVLSICRYTACRVSEALGLRWENITSTDVVIPRVVTKKKTKTRTIPMNPKLWDELETWRKLCSQTDRSDYLFPGRLDRSKHLASQTVDMALRRACLKLGIQGASTHSFRRTALTSASQKGIALRSLQVLSGHSSLEMLQRYIDVTDAQRRAAALAFD